MLHFEFMAILVLFGMVFLMFYGRISFKLTASAVASEFCEWVQVGIDVYIAHCKYQVNSHSSPWFSAVCATALVHRNHFFFFVSAE